MSNDIRVSDPTGSSLFESLQLKNTNEKVATPDNNVTKPEPVEGSAPQDNNDVTGHTESSSIKNVSFVDNEDFFKNSAPLINTETGDLLRFKATDSGLPIVDEQGQLQLDEGGKPLFIKVDANNQPIVDENDNLLFVETNQEQRDFFINKLKEQKTENTSEAASSSTNADSDDFQVYQLVNPETGTPLLFDYDNNGQPIFEYDVQGKIVSKENGQPAFYKADANGNPITDKDGNYVFLNPNNKQQPEIPIEAKKVMEVMNKHSVQRVVNGLWMKSFATSAVTGISKGLVKGVSVGIPFTKTAVGFGVKHAVAKAVGQEIKAMQGVAKTGSTTLVKSLQNASKPAAEGAIKTLTKGGVIGKGVQPIVMKEAAKEGGRIAGRVNAVKAGYEGTKGIVKSVSKGGVKEVGKVAQRAMVGSGEKVIQKGVQEGIEAGIKTAIKRGGAEITEKVVVKGTEKAMVKAAEKAAVKTAGKTAAKVGGRLASAVPVIGAVAGGAITAWDTADAIEKTKNGSVASAALAWTTVGLDVVATAATATGIGAPIGWIATGLSIGTSFLSDLF